MNNLKKFFAVVVAVAMLVTLISVPAMAATDYTTEANNLAAMDLLRGTDGDLMLDSAPDRLQALVMLLYLTGEAETAASYMTDEAAKEYLTGEGFTDVDSVVWGASILAYCVDNGYLYGGSGLLDAHGACSAEMFAAYMMRVIVDATDLPAWDGTSANLSALQAKGAYSNGDFATFFVAPQFTRELAAGMMYGVLSVPIEKEAGNGKTVAQNLYDNGVITAGQAANGNVSVANPTPTPVPDVAVESITGLNLIQAEVVFNMEVDEDTAEDTGNYTSDDATVANATLQSDGKTVVLTFDAVLGQEDKIDITVDGVEDTDENEVDETTVEDIIFSDKVDPTITKVEVTGVDNIKITFSEPIATTEANIEKALEVNDDDINIDEVALSKNNTVANVTILDEFETGTYTLKVSRNKIDDYAGFSVASETYTLDVVEDEDAPVIVDYKDCDNDEVTLVFDQDIVILDDTLTNFYHTNTGNIPNSIDLDGDELTLTFTDNELPDGTAYIYIKKEVLKDKWDNKNAKLTQEVAVEYDKDAPAVKKTEVKYDTDEGLYYLKITFEDDDLDDSVGTEATKESNYVVTDEDGEEVDIYDVTVNGDNDVVSVYFEDDDISGDFTIEISDVEDASGNEMEYTGTFTVEDEKKPEGADWTATVYNGSDEDQLIVIDFDEAMATTGIYSVLDASQYVVTVSGTAHDLSDVDCEVEINISSDNKKVEITLPSTEDDSDDGINVVVGATITVARVADAGGNYTEALSTTKTLAAPADVEVDSVKATDTDEIVITFEDKLDFDKDDVAIKYTVSGNIYSLEIAGVKESENSDGDTVVTITLDDDTNELNYDRTYTYTFGDDTTTDVAVYLDIVGSDSENDYGATIEDLDVGDDAAEVKDKIKPVLATVEDSDEEDVDNVEFDGVDTIILTFEEDINDDTVSYLTFSVGHADVKVTAIEVVGGNTIEITCEDDNDDDTKDLADYLKYGVDVEQEYGMKDANGNLVTGISTEINVVDGVVK